MKSFMVTIQGQNMITNKYKFKTLELTYNTMNNHVKSYDS